MRRIGVVALMVGLCACAQLRTYPAPLTAVEVSSEIARWQDASHRPGSEAEAHLKLSMLYSHPARPAPDYRRSAAELETYVALDPKGAEQVEVKRWLAVLRTLREAQNAVDRKTRESATLAEENRELNKNLIDARREAKEAREALAAQLKEKRELQEAIEKLKALDLQQDRLRRGQ